MGFAFLIVLLLVLWVAPILVARWLGGMYEMHNAWLWGLFLGWLGVGIICLKLPFRTAKVMKQSMQDAGLSTTLSGATKDAAVMMKRATGQIDGGKKCPACAETVQPDAKVCRYCGHQFAELEAAPEPAST